MNFIEAVHSTFSKYFQSSGRSLRSEFWYFNLFYYIVYGLCIFADVLISEKPSIEYLTDDLGLVSGLFLFATFAPYVSVTARRLHDVDRSGWWMLIPLTIIGILPYIYWMCKEGDAGENRFGPNPLGIEKPSSVSKRSLKWYVLVVAPISLILAGFLGFGIAVDQGFLPDTKVLPGNYLAQHHRDALISKGIIQERDHIVYYYSEGIISITEDGAILTGDHVITYLTDENEELGIYERSFNEIASVELENKGSFWEDSTYKITSLGSGNLMWVYLSTEDDGDQKFIGALKSKVSRLN